MFTGLSDGFKDVIRLDVDQNDGNLNTFVFSQFFLFFFLVFYWCLPLQLQNKKTTLLVYLVFLKHPLYLFAWIQGVSLRGCVSHKLPSQKHRHWFGHS